jgi:hypothetical protein
MGRDAPVGRVTASERERGQAAEQLRRDIMQRAVLAPGLLHKERYPRNRPWRPVGL